MFGWALVLTKVVLVIAASERIHVPTQAEPNVGNPEAPSLLQAAGFSPSCVATALASCTSQDENWFLNFLQETLTAVKETKNSEKNPRHCKDLLAAGDTGAGIRQVYPFRKHPDASVTVFCDQSVDGGGWTVFQRRRNLSEREDFYRTWVEYQLGFGHLEGEFWLGLDLLHQLTSVTLQELRIDLKNYEGEQRWAKYGRFNIMAPDTNYRISVGRYTGDAGDGLGGGRHDGYPFSTHDADHDNSTANCALAYRGAWWYDNCHISNLNGYQYVGKHESYADGIDWQPWEGYHDSLMETTMMIRPAF